MIIMSTHSLHDDDDEDDADDDDDDDNDDDHDHLHGADDTLLSSSSSRCSS